MSAWLQAIAAYSLPMQRQEESPPSTQDSDPPPVPAEDLMRQVQILMSENTHLRDTLHSRSGHCSPAARSTSPISESKKAANGREPTEPGFVCFLQNQVGFLRAALGQVNSPLPAQPIFLVQGEFFLLLRKALSASLETISQFLGHLSNQEESLYQTYVDLQSRVQTYCLKYTFDTSLFAQLMALVEESESLKQRLLVILKGKMQDLSEELTELIYASFKMIMPLAVNLKDEADINELRSWNERKIEISTEEGTFELLFCKQKMLYDLESLKTSLLERNFRMLSSVQSPIPKSPAPFRLKPKSLPETTAPEPLQMLPYLSAEANLLLEALNQAKDEVGSWPWRKSPLLPSERRDCRNWHDLGAVIKAAKGEVEEITKVARADKPEIIRKVQKLLKEDYLERSNADLVAEMERNRTEKEQFQAEIHRLSTDLESEKSKNQEILLSYQTLQSQFTFTTSKNEELSQELTQLRTSHQETTSQLNISLSSLELQVTRLSSDLSHYQALYEDLQKQIAAFIARANGKVFHSRADTLRGIAEEIEALNRRYEESIETVVMQSFEPRLLRVVTGIKLRFSEGEAEAVWKGMQYLVEAGDQTARTAGCEPGAREKSSEMTSTVMKTLQHYVFEDLKMIEDRVIEMLMALQGLVEEKEGLLGSLEAAGWRESQAEGTKREEIAALMQELDCLRKHSAELERDNQILRKELQYLEIPIYASSPQDFSDEVSRGTGGNVAQSLSKGLDFTIRLLSQEVLKRPVTPPAELMQKQAVLYDLAVQVQQAFGQKETALQGDIDDLQYQIMRVRDERDGVIQVNLSLRGELDAARKSNKSLLNEKFDLEDAHTEAMKKLKQELGLEKEFTAQQTAEIARLKALVQQLEREKKAFNEQFSQEIACQKDLIAANTSQIAELTAQIQQLESEKKALEAQYSQELASQRDIATAQTSQIASLTASIQQLDSEKKASEAQYTQEITTEKSISASQALDLQRLQALVRELEADKERIRTLGEKEAAQLREQLDAETVVLTAAETLRNGDLEGGTRLQTAGSIEEKLIKGFEYICIRAKNITENTQILPKEPLDKQKYLYDRLEDIENLIMEVRKTEAGLRLESQELSARLKAMEERCTVHSRELAQVQDQLRQSTDENRRKSNEIEVCTADISRLQTDLAHATSELTTKSSALAEQTSEAEKLHKSLQDCEQSCNQQTSLIAQLHAEIDALKQSFEAEKAKMRHDFETERQSTSQEVESRQRKQIQELDDRIAALGLENDRLRHDVERERADHKQDQERRIADLDRERKEKEAVTAQLKLTQAEAARAQKDSSEQWRKLTEDSNRKIRENQALIDQLRSRLAEVESLVYVTPVQTTEEPETPRQRERLVAYHRKVHTGFDFLNAKLRVMAFKEDFVSNNLLENQMQMYKQLLDVERLLYVSREEKDKANEELAGAIRKLERLNQEVMKLLEEKAQAFKDHSEETGKLKGKVATLENDSKKLSELMYKTKSSEESANRQLSATKQTLEDLRRENQNLRSQLGSDFTIAYPSEGGSPVSDETPRRHLQSQGSIETRLDKGFDAILKVTQAVTGHTYPIISNLLDKQKAVYDEVIALTASKSEAAHETSQLLTTCNEDLVKSREEIDQLTAQLSHLASTQNRLEASNKALLQQLSVKELAGVDSDSAVTPHETRSHLQAGASITEKLSKGFDYSIVEVAKAIGRKVDAPEEMLEKQRLLFDLTITLIRDYGNVRPVVIDHHQKMVEKEEKLRAVADEHVRKLEERLRGVVLLLKGKRERYVAEKDRFRIEIAGLKDQIASLTDSLQRKSTENAGLVQAKATSESSLEQEKAALLAQLQQKTTECESLSSAQLKLQESNSLLNAEISQLRTQIDQLSQDKLTLTKEKQDFQDEISRLRQQVESTSQQLTAIQASHSALQASGPEQARQLEEARVLIQQLTQQNKELAENIKKLEDLLNDANQRNGENQKKLTTLEEEMRTVLKAKNEGNEARKELGQKLAESEAKLLQAGKESAELRSRTEELEKQLADIRHLADTVAKEKAQLEETHRSLETDRTHLMETKAGLEGQIQTLNSTITQTKTDHEKETSRLQKELTSKQLLSEQLQRDLETYRNAVSAMYKEIQAIHGVFVQEGDTPESICKAVVEVVRAQSEKLRLVREKWILLKSPLESVLKAVLSSISGLSEDLADVELEQVRLEAARISGELLPPLSTCQSQISERTTRLIALFKDFSPADIPEIDPFPSTSLIDFLLWVAEKENLFIAILEKSQGLARSVPTVYDLAKQVHLRFGVSVEQHAKDQQLLTLSLTSEVYLRALLAVEMGNIPAVKKLITEARNLLQETIEQLTHERDTERNRADIEARLREKEAEDHEIVKREATLLKKQSQILETSLNEMQQRAADAPKSAEDTQAEMEALKLSFQASLDKVRDEAVKLKLIRTIKRLMYPAASECLEKWRIVAKSKTDSIYTDPAQYQTDSLKTAKLDLVRRNTILHLTSTSPSTEKPMPEFALYRLASEIMLARTATPVTTDTETLPQFTVVFLTEKLKSSEAAVKQLKQMIPTLWNFKEDKYYGVLLARMFQIKNPLSNSLVAFLIQANSEMQKLVQKRLQIKQASAGGKKALASPDPLTGGRIFLCDALSLIYDLKLDSDRNVCRRILNRLRDPEMEKTDYVTFIINHRLEWLQLDNREFFTQIDRARQGVTVPTLIEAFKVQLQLCVSDKKLLEVFSAKVDRNRSGQVGAEEFGVYMDVTYYKLNAAHDNYSVDKNFFLCVLGDVFDMMVEGLVTNITEIWTNKPEGERVGALMSAWPIGTEAEIRGILGETRKAGPESVLSLLVQREFKGMFVKPFGII